MAITQAELDSFHRFATEQLDTSGPELSWDELFIRWQSAQERGAVNAAIERGLADVEAGRHRGADDVMRDLQCEFGLDKR